MGCKAWALLLAFVAALPGPASAGDSARTCRRSEGRFAFERVHTLIQREKLFADHIKGARECVFYSPYPCDSQWIHITIHEQHDEVCSGDPATAPALAHFRLHRKTGVIEWMEITSGDYLPFEHICSQWRCAKLVAPPPRPQS